MLLLRYYRKTLVLVLLFCSSPGKKEAVIHFSHPKPLLPNDFLRIFVKVKIVRFQGPF